MTELTRLKKSRSANKNAVNRVVKQAIDKMNGDYNEDTRLDVEVYLRTIKAKEILIQKLDADIVNVIEDEEVDDDVDNATDFGVKMTKDIAVIEGYLEKNKVRSRQDAKGSAVTTGVKLPKIVIKKFNGDPTAWQQFQETLL